MANAAIHPIHPTTSVRGHESQFAKAPDNMNEMPANEAPSGRSPSTLART